MVKLFDRDVLAEHDCTACEHTGTCAIEDLKQTVDLCGYDEYIDALSSNMQVKALAIKASLDLVTSFGRAYREASEDKERKDWFSLADEVVDEFRITMLGMMIMGMHYGRVFPLEVDQDGQG